MLPKALLMTWLVLVTQQDAGQAQLSFHTDANTNSFTLKTPGLQQSFTRYFGAAKPAQQEQQQQLQEQEPVQSQVQAQEQQLQNPAPFTGFSPAGLQYSAVYPQQQSSQVGQGATALRGGAKLKSAAGPSPQQQQQQQLLAQQQFLGAAGGAVANMPSYADQMHAAFLDYQRQRVEFEQQQQQLLQKLYHYYPDVSGSLGSQAAATAQPAPTPARFVHRQQSASSFGTNGLQPQSQPQSLRQTNRSPAVPDFYSTQHHLGFLQQQQQDVLREQQQQFANSQLAPSTTQNYGMAVPMSSVLGAPSYQSSADVSHVNFSSGNLNYSF